MGPAWLYPGIPMGAAVSKAQASHKEEQGECEVQRDAGFGFDLSTMD